MSLFENKRFFQGAGVASIVVKGECFWVISPGKGSVRKTLKHRHAAMNNGRNKDLVVFLSVQTWHDDFRRFPVGKYKRLFLNDHKDFLERDSCIDFTKAIAHEAEHVRRCHRNGKGKNWIKIPKGFSTELVEGLIVDFCESKFAKKELVKMLAAVYAEIKGRKK